MNSRFLPPDASPPKAGGGGGGLSSKKVRPQNSNNPIPASRDFSLLTALVGAMIVNESERNLHQAQPTSFFAYLHDLFSKSVSSDSSTQAIISVAALESLEQIQEYLENISQARIISFADVENLVINFTDELFPHLTSHALSYHIVNPSFRALQAKYIDASLQEVALSEASDRTDRSIDLGQFVDELAQHNSDWWYRLSDLVVDKSFHFYTVIAEIRDREAAFEIDSDILDFQFAQEFPADSTYQLAAVKSKDQDTQKTNSLNESELKELKIEDAEIDSTQTLIAENSDTTYYPPVAAGGGGGGGGGGISSTAAAPTSFSGSVIDGYVSGATVFIDIDNDKTLDWVDTNADGIWTAGEGEAWTTTDANGAYTFAADVNVFAGKIVSLGGTDITTGAAITILSAEAGSQYITPISTAYVSAGTSGATLLASMGLSAADLLYDPVSSTSANATTVLKTGSSLLTIINNASALATELGGVSSAAAASSAFSSLANLSSSALTNLFGTSSTDASASMTTFLTGALNSSGINAANYSTAISATASSVSAITTALQGLSASAVKSGELYQLAASGQSTLMADIKSLGSAAAAGEDLTAKISSLQGSYTAANLNVLKAASAARLAFNTQDPTNPITTTADTFTLEAPVSGAPVVKLFNPLSNDKMTGSGGLGLAAVGLFDTKAFNGSINPASNTGVTGNKIKFSASQSAVEDFYKGMAITLLTASGPVLTTITSYNGQTKEATLGTTLSSTVLNDITTKGASYLVSKAVPANISFVIMNDKIQITNTYDKDYEFGQLDLIYVAQQVGNPQIAKTGLATVNVQPPIPTVTHLSTFASGKTLQVTEAVTGAANQKIVNISSVDRNFTEIALPLKVSGLGVTGNLQIQGLPTGSYLSYTKADGTVVTIAKDVGSPNWTISGANALDGRIYSSLKLLIPSDLSAEYALKIFATSRYGGLSSRASESVTISISANADGLQVSPGTEFNAINALVDNTIPATGLEDTTFVLVANEIDAMVSALNAKRIDSDSEKVGLRIELPTGFNVSFTNPAVKQQTITASDGKVTVQLYESDSVSLTSALQAIRFIPKADFSGVASIQIFAGAFEPSLAVNGIPTASGPGALKLLANPFSASIGIAPVSDLPVLEAPTIVLKDGIPWNQDHSNYKLADGRYRTSIKTKVNSTDVDGSEKVYVDIRKAELSEAGAVLDVGGKTEIIQIKQTDSSGRAISFLSSATDGNVSDLVKSGTGTAQVEITQGSTGVKEVTEVIFNNLSTGKTIGFGGLVFTAGSSGATASQIAEAFASKAVGFSANNTAMPGGVLSGTLSGWGTGAKETVWYRVDTGAVQSVDVIAPSTTAKPISIFLRPAAIDSGAGLTATSTISSTLQSLTIPFEDRPATPSLTVIPTATGLEDQTTLFLSQFIKVDPAVGRSLDTITVFTQLANTFQLVSANGSQLTKSTKTGFTDYYEVAASDLSTTRIKTPEHFKGAITSKTFARDTASNGLVADTAKGNNDGNSTYNIGAVADGVNIASGVLALDLNVGVEAKLYDPANPTVSLFSKISLKDSSESYVAKLVFKATPADALIIKVAGKLVLGQAEGADIVYSFTQAQLSSTNVNDSITILAKNGLFGKSVLLQGVSNDLTSASGIVEKSVTVNLSATAVAPDVSLSSARGNEDTAISVPVKVAINPERTSFEKIGFEITLNSTGTTNTNDAQDAVTILSTGKFKVGADEFSFGPTGSPGKWVVYKDSAQLNFDNLTFTPPVNYSGKVVFNFKSFSQTSSGSKTYASADTPVTVTVDPVAETVVFKTPTAITGVEDQAAIDFAIANYFDKTKLTDLGETVNIEISIASAITLKKGSTNIIPTSNAASVSTYVIPVDVDKWDATLAGYQLVLANNFASDATNGLNAIVAGRGISLKATAFEQSGETATPQTLNINLTISPVADRPDSPRLLREAITLNESQASGHTWFDAKEAIKLSSLISSDASETLSVQITAANSLVLTLRNGDVFTAIGSTAKVIGASTTVYTLTPAQYESLVLRGDNYASGNADFKVKVISTESWGESTAASNEQAAVFTLKPVASGLSSTLALKANFSRSEDTAGVTLNEFIQTNSGLNDSSEILFYRVGVPTNCKLVGINGATLPSASITGTGNDAITLYNINANQLQQFKLVPNENFSGILGLTFQSFSQESDLSNSSFSASQSFTLTVNPVSDTPLLIAPASASGLISNNARISVPIQAILGDADGSEALSVKLKFTGISATSDLSLKLDGADLAITKTGSDYVASIPTDKISKLSTLTVSSSKDFRLTNSVKMVVEATSVDGTGAGAASGAVSTKTVDLSIYQPISAPTLNLSGEVNAITKLAVPYTLSLPTSLPAGIPLDSVSVIVNGVPSLAYFATREGTTLKPIGASLGEGGVWLFKASELLNTNGTQKPLALINSAETRNSSGDVVQVSISGQAFINDPIGGSTAQSASRSFKVSFAVSNAGDSSDPLVLSLGGTPIASSAITGAAFELDALLNGAESPTYWLSGNPIDKTGYAFLVKPGVAVGTALTLSNLYTDFAELYAKPGVDVSDGKISGADLTGLSLWFDANSNAVLDNGELVSISALSNFSITVPETVARESASGEIVSLYEAKAQWTGAPTDGGALFAVAIPYLPNSIANPITSAVTDNNYFDTRPSAALRILGEKQTAGGGATVPEDLEGGIRFMVDLSKSSIKTGVSQPMHLIKIYGVPDGVELSAGAEVPAEGTPGTSSYKKSFWLVTEDSIAAPITMTGLPENYSGAINLTAQAVASLIQGGVVQTISQASESATAQVVVSGLADKPFLDGTISELSLNEGGEIYLTADGQANSVGLVSLSQMDSDLNEALFVRFSLDTAGSNYVVKNYASNPSGVVLASTNGKYEVLYADLPKIKIDFNPFFAMPTEIILEGISKQGVTVATADYAATTYLDFTPVADGIQSIDVKTKEGSSITSGISVLEGVAPIINLSTVTRDSKEIAEFEIVVGGSVAGQAALQFIVNADEWEWSDTGEKSDYLDKIWGIDVNPEFWKVFYVSASGINGQFTTNPLELIIDEYFDGTISYQARAISIDPIYGETSSLISSPQKSGSITVAPSVNQDDIILELLDATTTSRDPIFSLNLNEGGASDWFVASGISLDSDETVAVTLGINTSYFAIQSQTVSNEIQYRVVHTGTSVPTDTTSLLLKPIVTVSDVSAGQSTATASYPSASQTNPYAISLEINKSASTPILSSVAELSAAIADGNDAGISIALPTKSADTSDDQLTYQLSGVPDWLYPSAGVLIDVVTDANGVSTYTYQFEATDLAGLKWAAARTFNPDNLIAEMQWQAIHTEISNFEQKFSTAVTIIMTKTPVAVEPEILGPSSVYIDEAGFIELKEYSVEVPGFSDTVANSSILVDVNLGAGTKLTYLQAPSSPSSLLSINASASPEASLTLAQLQTAKISAIDPNYYGYTTDSGPRGSGPLSFSLSAKQTLGSSIAQSVTTKAVSISIENIPEDVSLAAVDVIPTSENVDEGAVYALPKFVLNGTASGEDAYISLGVNSEFIVRDISGTQEIELPIFYEVEHAEYYESFYDLNLVKLSLGNYELLIPSGATTGSHTINLYAQSFDPATGAAGQEDLETFTINVRPTADTPVLIVPSEYELSEDELQDLYFSVTAFSPDWRESVEVQVTIIGPDGQPVPNFMIYASDVDFSALTLNGETVGIKYRLDPDQLDPIYMSVTAPADFYNADASGQFITNANIEQRYSIQVSTTSIYQDGATAILSAPVTRSTVFIVRADSGDAPIITNGTFAGSFNETSTLPITGIFSYSDPDLTDRPTAQFEFIGASGVQSDGQSPFALTDDQLAVIASGFSLPSSTSTANQGNFSWQYTRSSSQLDFLGQDDELTALFRVTITDVNGATVTQDVTITITGTNDTPTITTVAGITDVTGAVSEDADSATLSDTGTITFDDVDLTNTHSALAAPASGNTLGGTLTLGSVSESVSTSTGSVPWTYTIPTSATQYLATGQTASEVFTVTITDVNGATVTQDVTITITGTNDTPTLTAFAASIDATIEDTSVEITLADLLAQGNEADVDGTVTGFVIKSVASGTLKIGTDTASALAWNVTTNATVDTTNKAYWTPDANTNGTLNAFTAVAKDNSGAESATAIPVTVTVAAVNDAPVITSSSSGAVEENTATTTVIYTATATQAGSTLTYTLAGVDADLFNINASTGAVTFRSAPDFEVPGDEDNNNVYDITVTASNELYTSSLPKAVAITVSNVYESPVMVTGASWATSFNEGALSSKLNMDVPNTIRNSVSGYASSTASATVDATNGFAITVAGTTYNTNGNKTMSGVVTANAVPVLNDSPSITDLMNWINGLGEHVSAGVVETTGSSNWALMIQGTQTGTTNAISFTGLTGLTDAPPTLTNTSVTAASVVLDAAYQRLDFSAQGIRFLYEYYYRDDAPIVWADLPEVELGQSWSVQTRVSINDGLAKPEQSAGIVFYDADGGVPNFYFSLTKWIQPTWSLSDVAAVATQSGGGNGISGEAYTLLLPETSDVYLKVQVTELGLTDHYQFFYKGLSAQDPWIAVGDARTYTAKGNDSRVGLFYKTNKVTTGVAFDDFAITVPVSVAENSIGTVYTANAIAEVGNTLTYALTGIDSDLFSINTNTGALAFIAAPNFENPLDHDGDNLYDLTVAASDGVATSVPQSVVIAVTNVVEPSAVNVTVAPAQVTEGDAGKLVYTFTRSNDLDAELTVNIGVTGSAGIEDYSRPMQSQWTHLLGASRYPPWPPSAAAVGAKGAVYVSGRADSSLLDGSNVLSEYGGGYVRKFDADGYLVWTRLTNVNDNYPYSVTTDIDGGVYVAGMAYNPDAYYDGFVTKFDPAGALEWTSFVGGPGLEYDYIKSVSTDANGAVYVAGLSYDVNWTTASPFISKLDNYGNLEWTRPVASNDSPVISVSPTADGAVYVTGYSNSAIYDGTTLLSNYGGGYIRKFDAGGILKWTRLPDASGSSQPNSVSAAADGAVYVAGYAYNAVSQNNDGFVTKFDAAGKLVWTSFVGGSGHDDIKSVFTGEDGAVYLAGETYSSSLNGQAIQGAPNTTNGFVGKLDAADGALAWTHLIGGSSNDLIKSISADVDGVIYITGETYSSSLNGQNNQGNVTGFVSKILPASLTQVTFAPGSATAMLTLTATADAVTEGNDTVIVKVKPGQAYTVGSSATATGTIEDNLAPSITSTNMVSVAENTSGTVYTVIATDANAGSTLTYALGGVDAALFNINASTGAVTFRSAPDFETPGDVGYNNVYDITVTANDGVNTSAAQAAAITVTNVDATVNVAVTARLITTPLNFGLSTNGSVDGAQSVYLIPVDGFASAIGQDVLTWSFASGNFDGDRSITPLLFEKVGEDYVLRAIGSTQQAQGNTVYQDLAFNLLAGDASIKNVNYIFGWKDGTQTQDNGGVIANVIGSPGLWISRQQGQVITAQNIDLPVDFSVRYDTSYGGRDYQFSVNTGMTKDQPVVTEGDVAQLLYTFTRSGDIDGALTVSFERDGTATADDYAPSLSTITFAAGSSTATLALSARSDQLTEIDETLTVTLIPGQGYSLGLSASATGTIQNKLPTVSTVTEATTAAVTKDPITFTVTFSETLTGTVGTSNFTASNGTVTSVTRVDTSNVYTVVVTPTAGVASGTVALSLVGAGLTDAVGNQVADADLSSLASQAVDTLSPMATFTAVKNSLGGALSAGLTNSASLELSGSNEAGASVSVYNGSTLLGQAVVIGTNWTYSVTTTNGITYDLQAQEIDAAGNFGPLKAYFAGAGDAVIDLGKGNGQLIAPVQVDGGKWFYHWDVSGDGTAFDKANENFADHVLGWQLHDIFNKDVNGVQGPGTSDTYRYATLNGVQLALPTIGLMDDVVATFNIDGSVATLVGKDYEVTGISGIAYTEQAGSAIGSLNPSEGDNTINPLYDDLLAIWDAYNGNGITESWRYNQFETGWGDKPNISGMPTGWSSQGSPSYASASHNYVLGWNAFQRFYDLDLSSGTIMGNAEGERDSQYNKFMVALQVLGRPVIVVDTTAPTLANTVPAVALGSVLAGSAGDSAGETITLTLTFAGTVNGLTSGTDNTIFTVVGSGVSATWSGTGNTRTLTYTIAAGQNGQAAIDEAALKTALIAGIADAAGNAFAYSGDISNIDVSPLPVVDTRFDAAKDFIAGPTAQSANNIWQYFSADYSNSNLSNLQLLSNWDTDGTPLISLPQWDGNRTDENYPFVQKQLTGDLIVHPDNTGKAVVVAWKNTTASNVTVDLSGSLNLVGNELSRYGPLSSYGQNPSNDGITYLVTTSSTAYASGTPTVLLSGTLDENTSTSSPDNINLLLSSQTLAPGAMISVAVHGNSTYFWDHTQLDLQITPRPASINGTTPLILDLNNDGVRTLGTDAGVKYDLTGSGLLASVGWSSPEDGFLVRDMNDDGLINDGTEMFGEATVLANGERAQDGFEALSDLDTNQDGLIDSQDEAFNSLAIWRDANMDGLTNAGELLTLAQRDIASLNLSYTESDRVDNGNQLRLVSNYTTTDGTSYEMVDVWLTTNYQTNMSETPAVPAVLEKLTDTAGQDHFEVSQLVFHEQYSQRAMESALDYYLDEQDASELSQAIFEIHGGDSTKPSEVHLAGLLQNYANDETDEDQLSFTGFSDSATIETRNIMTSSNKEFAYTYVSDQQIDKNVYTGLLIDLGLSATPNHDEILHLEIKKN